MMPFRLKFFKNIVLAFLFWGIVVGTSGQESGSLYYLPGIQQWSLENPAMQNQPGQLVIGMPFLSGISGQWGSSVPINSLFSKGFDYSFSRFYDALGEEGEIQASAGAVLFFAGFRHQIYSFSFSVSERAFAEGIFDREIISIIRDGTKNYYDEKKDEELGRASFFLTHYREIAPGISIKWGDRLDVGIRPKFLFGKLHFSGRDLSMAVKADTIKEELTITTDGNFLLAGPFYPEFDTISMTNKFMTDLSPGDYFFQPKNYGVALDLGLVYRPTKSSDISLSISDIGFVGFRHEIYNTGIQQVKFPKNNTYQSNPGEKQYLEPYQALKNFLDSLSYEIIEQPGKRPSYTIPFKINFAGKYHFTKNLTSGFQYQYKNYQLSPVNLFTLFATATIQPGISFYGSLSALNTPKNIFPGLGASYTTDWLQIYFTSYNISGIFQPMATKQLNLSFGINFLFETQ